MSFKSFKFSFLLLPCLFLISCASGRLVDFTDEFQQEDEYDAAIAVETVEPVIETEDATAVKTAQSASPSAKEKNSGAGHDRDKVAAEPSTKNSKTSKTSVKSKQEKTKPKKQRPAKKLIPKNVEKKGRKLPLIEDDEGFVGRRPLKDPFNVGEEVVLGIRYLGVKAGELKLKVLPFKVVNGRKAYHFRTEIISSSSYKYIYEVNDWAETFVDYESLLPFNYTVHVNHTNEKKQIKSVFDHANKLVKVWEKKIDDDGNVKRKSYQWEMLAFSQNVISAFFYIRNFELKVGKTLKFPMTDENNNMVLEASIVRKEKLETKLGEIEAFVVVPKVSMEGKFKPVGDVFLWFRADESKQIVRVESALEIGTLKFDLISIK